MKGFENRKDDPAFQEKVREVFVDPILPELSRTTRMRYVEVFDVVDDKLRTTVEGPNEAKA